MRIKPASRAVVVFILCIALLVPAVALASSYWSSLSFVYQLRGTTRYYDNNDMNIQLYSNESWHHVTNHYYKIELVRDGVWDTKIGSVTVPRQGWGSGRWTNVGSGYYYFFFSKADDGVRITSDNVHMWSD